MLRVYNQVRQLGITLIGRNCPGVLSPGKTNIGIGPAEIFSRVGGSRLAIRDAHVPDRARADPARHRAVDNRRNRGGARHRVVPHGHARQASRPIRDGTGSDGRRDRQGRGGEGGGVIGERDEKPVVAYIAGFTAPPGKTMGHAGAIISSCAGTARAKKKTLKGKGVRVSTNTTEAASPQPNRRRPNRLAAPEAPLEHPPPTAEADEQEQGAEREDRQDEWAGVSSRLRKRRQGHPTRLPRLCRARLHRLAVRRRRSWARRPGFPPPPPFPPPPRLPSPGHWCEIPCELPASAPCAPEPLLPAGPRTGRLPCRRHRYQAPAQPGLRPGRWRARCREPAPRPASSRPEAEVPAGAEELGELQEAEELEELEALEELEPGGS